MQNNHNFTPRGKQNGKLSVLIADDEATIRHGIAKLIETSQLDLTVAALVEDGQEALKLAKELQPEIIIMDIHMPQLNGLEAIEQIKAVSSESIIMIVSGYNDFTYAQKAIDLGVFKYLLKPLDRHNFVHILKQAMESWMHRQTERGLSSPWIEAIPEDNGTSALRFIHEHFRDSELTLSHVAQQFYLSPSNLSRIIKEKTSYSFTDYVNRLRIELAIDLMHRYPSLTMHDISERCGYNSQHYFSRAFKNYTGTTPMQYRMKKD